ncbi:TPA: hypothetical protein DEO28_04500 [Candidatus Dependentiae bacterium]|nr:MAG: Biotin/lipoyl attachment domain-containing protein [candidate division TM6 bacterium GW2011_GWE2_31_21]KKP53815.1 MAG: Biotin/lipoyl attachment domain-containing protein [candidate division TM6 bacterium GW2011_GWF2_33_332]HBS47595.1 hypothetical protein [Candidatus Dependentiae bacterium]HBZ73744.1 hypothetical protein [Candidatus Dependentiae bacterium]
MEIKNFSIKSQNNSSNYQVELKTLAGNKSLITLKNKSTNKSFEVTFLKFEENNQTIFFEINQKLFKARVVKNNKTNQYLIHLLNGNQTKQTTFQISSLYNPSSQVFENKKESIRKNELRAPLSGRIIKCLVKRGEKVSKNQSLVIIESMKIENEIRCDNDAIIKTISICEGDLVKKDQVLISFET